MTSSNAHLIAAIAQAQATLAPLFQHLQQVLRRVDELEQENRALRDNVQHRAATAIQRCFRRWRILHQVRDMIYELGIRRRLQIRRYSTRTLETESSSDECHTDCYESTSAMISAPRRKLLMELERRISDYVDFELLQNGLRRPSGLSDDGTVLQGTPRNTLIIPPLDIQALTRYSESGGSYSEDEPGVNRAPLTPSPYPSVLLTPMKDENDECYFSSKSKRKFATQMDPLKALFDRGEQNSKTV